MLIVPMNRVPDRVSLSYRCTVESRRILTHSGALVGLKIFDLPFALVMPNVEYAAFRPNPGYVINGLHIELIAMESTGSVVSLTRKLRRDLLSHGINSTTPQLLL